LWAKTIIIHEFNLREKKEVTVNGARRFFLAEDTVLDVIRSLNLEPERVAVELNRAIVKREAWSVTRFETGSEIEIVQFVGGG
jgi:thiamine biosynthesis protein ThiS